MLCYRVKFCVHKTDMAGSTSLAEEIRPFNEIDRY